MASFCREKEVPIPIGVLTKSYNFKENGIVDNVKFLRNIRKRLHDYSFDNGEPVTFENSQKDVAFLRYHYLHWNATYGDSHESVGTWLSGKNDPNMDDNGKRKRHVR